LRYQRFEELPVWNDAIDLTIRLFQLLEKGQLSRIGDLKNQLERAAISISNNIAEGFERGTNDELIAFLYISRGSAGEVRSMLHLLKRLSGKPELDRQLEELIGGVERISRQLGGWVESLRDSPFRGTRSQNAQTRKAAEVAKRRDDFAAKLREIQAQSGQESSDPPKARRSDA